MRKVFINSAACISAQRSLESDFISSVEPITHQSLAVAQQPEYKNFISPAAARRMSKVVKMGTVASQNALAEAGIAIPEAIIVGTGIGCSEDSEKFLKNVVQNGEEFLTPTHFIQSTHNTVAGNIAMATGCHGYNFTYVNSGSALEMSLLDAQLQISSGEADAILIGTADETSKRTAELYQLIHWIRSGENLPVDFLNSDTKGVIWGEGASFFVLSSTQTENTLCELIDTEFINRLSIAQVENFCGNFLTRHALQADDIDIVLFGFSGDVDADAYYKPAQTIFGNSTQLFFKHLCGEFNTASGFALFLATQIFATQRIPEVAIIVDRQRKPQNILIFNNFLSKDHSLTLLRSVH